MVEGTKGSHHKEGSTKMSKHTTSAAGIDTGKYKLDIALHGRKDCLQVNNDEAGHGQLSAWLRRHRIKRVGIEASGGYERTVIARLRSDGFTVIRFQPLQVRAYADFRLQRAKNDKIDAVLIAACAAEASTIREAPDPRLEPLAEHLTLVEQIEEDIARFKTRREAVRDVKLRQRLKEEIARLQAWRRRELKQILAELRQHEDLARRLALAESVEGVGQRTALAFIIRAPELGRISREQAAALVGVAPFDHDSSEHQGARHIAGGRARLRKSVYAAALPAAFHWNPHVMALYKRLVAAGKPHKLALIACTRKLVIYVNTVLARGTPWTSRTLPA
jgi:transposase